MSWSTTARWFWKVREIRSSMLILECIALPRVILANLGCSLRVSKTLPSHRRGLTKKLRESGNSKSPRNRQRSLPLARKATQFSARILRFLKVIGLMEPRKPCVTRTHLETLSRTFRRPKNQKRSLQLLKGKWLKSRSLKFKKTC